MPAAPAERRRRPRLLALRALGLGDLLTAVPALRALARAFPEHQRLLAAPRWLVPLLPLIDADGRPCLDGIVALDGRVGLGTDRSAGHGADRSAGRGADPAANSGADPSAKNGADPAPGLGADPSADLGADRSADPAPGLGADPGAKNGADPAPGLGADRSADLGADPPANSGADPPALPARPQLAVNLHGRGPQSHRLLLGRDPEHLIAFRHPEVRGTEAMPTWRAEEHEVERWCRLLRESGIPADPDELAIRPPRAEAPERARGATLLHPGAASRARRWPPERWAAVARAERDAGRRVVVTGSRSELPVALRVAAFARLEPECVFAGAGDLLALAGLVAAAGAVVCGDTGVGHLATALGVPSVLLFGPTPPSLWGPPAGRPEHRVLWSGRRGDPHAAAPDPGLLRIEPEAVLAELRALRAPAGARG